MKKSCIKMKQNAGGPVALPYIAVCQFSNSFSQGWLLMVRPFSMNFS